VAAPRGRCGQAFSRWDPGSRAPGPTAIDVAGHIHLHTIGTPGSSPRSPQRTWSVHFASVPLGLQVKGPNRASPGVVNVQHAFIRREGEAVGQDKVVDEQGKRAQIGCDAVHTRKG